MMSSYDCADVRTAILEGRLDEPGVRSHIDGCEACAELATPQLAELLAAQGEEEPLPDGLKQSIVDAVAQASPPAPRGARVGGVMLGLTGGAMLFGLLRARPDLADLPWGRTVGLLGAFAVAAGIGVWLVARPPWRAPLGPTRRGAALGVLWALPALALALPLAEPMGVGALSVPTLLCLGYGSVMVVLSVGVLGAAFRRDTLLGARWPVAAATGAVLGNMSLLLHCPAQDAGHMWVGHVGLGLLAAAAAGLGSALSLTPAGAAR